MTLKVETILFSLTRIQARCKTMNNLHAIFFQTMCLKEFQTIWGVSKYAFVHFIERELGISLRDLLFFPF